MRKLVSLSNYMITRYIGKNLFECEMCGKRSKLMLQWDAILTGIKMQNKLTKDEDLNLIIAILDRAEGVSKQDFKRLTKKITDLGASYEKTNK